MKKKLLKTVYVGGLKRSKGVIEVSEREAEILLNTKSLDVFYSKIEASRERTTE